MSKRTSVQNTESVDEEDANSRRRSTRIAAAVVTRRASASEETQTTPAKLTRAKRLSLSQDSAVSKNNDDKDDAISVSSTSSSQGRSTPKLQVVTRGASKSPQSKAKTNETKDVPVRRTRSRGSMSSLADDQDRVASPVPTRQTRQSSTHSVSESTTSEQETAANKVNTPRKSTRSVSASPTSSGTPVSKLKGRRSSVTEKIIPLESIDETDSSSSVKDASVSAVESAAKTRGRRPSVTEAIVPLESIEETESKQNENDKEEEQKTEDKDTKDDNLPLKKKKVLIKEQNLQTITETSFVEESERSSTVNETDSQSESAKERTDLNKKEEEVILNSKAVKMSPEKSDQIKESPSLSKSKSSKLSLIKSRDVKEESEEEKQLKMVLNTDTEENPSLRRSPRKSLNASTSGPEETVTANIELKKSSDILSKNALQAENNTNNVTADSEESFGLNLHISESDVSQENLEAKTNEQHKQEVLNISGSSNTSDKENQQLKAKLTETKASPKMTDSTKKKWLSEFNAQAVKEVTKGSSAKSVINELDTSKSSKDVEPSFYEPMDVDEYPSYIEIDVQNDDSSPFHKKNDTSPTKKSLEESDKTPIAKPLEEADKLSKNVKELEKSPSLLKKTTPVLKKQLETSEISTKSVNSSTKASFNLSENDVLKIDISSESLDLEKPKVYSVTSESPKLSSPIRRSARLLKHIDSPGTENIVNSTPKQKLNQDNCDDESDSPTSKKLPSLDVDASNSQNEETADQNSIKSNSNLEEVPKQHEQVKKDNADNKMSIELSDQDNGQDKNLQANKSKESSMNALNLDSADCSETQIIEGTSSKDELNESEFIKPNANGNVHEKNKKDSIQHQKSATKTEHAKIRLMVESDDNDNKNTKVENVREPSKEKSFSHKSKSKQSKSLSFSEDNTNKKSENQKKFKSKEKQNPTESFNDDDQEDSDLYEKIDNLIANRLDSSSSSDEESITHFLDDMAEEGEEDTPSEGSNDIIDEGESVGSTESEVDSDESYEHDSFINDDEEIELLSGAEFDLGQETKKPKRKLRSRIIQISDTDEEDDKKENISSSKNPIPVNETKSPARNKNTKHNDSTASSEKMRNGIEEDSDLEKMSTQPYCGLTPPSIVSLRDSLSDNEDDKIEDIKDDEDSIVSVLINKEDNLKSLEEIQQQRNSNKFEKSSINKNQSLIQENGDVTKTPQNIKTSSAAPAIYTPNNSILENEAAPESDKSARKRLSSITIQESISLKDIEEGNISDRISKVVDVFCSSVKKDSKDPSGNISLNISLDYLKSTSPVEEIVKQDITKEGFSKIPVELGKETETVRHSDLQKHKAKDQVKNDKLTEHNEVLEENHMNTRRRLSQEYSKKPEKTQISAYEQYKILEISAGHKALPEELQNKEQGLSKRKRKKKMHSLGIDEQKDCDLAEVTDSDDDDDDDYIIQSKSSKPIGKKTTLPKVHNEKDRKDDQTSSSDVAFSSDSEMSEDLDKELCEKYSSKTSNQFSYGSSPSSTVMVPTTKKQFGGVVEVKIEVPTKKLKIVKKFKPIDDDDVADSNSNELYKKVKKPKKEKSNENCNLQEITDIEGATKIKMKTSKLQTEVFDSSDGPTKKPKKPKIKITTESDYVSDEVFVEQSGVKNKKSKISKQLDTEAMETHQSTKSKKKSKTSMALEKLQFKPGPSNIHYFPSSTLQELTKYDQRKMPSTMLAPVVSEYSESNKNKQVRKPKLVPSSSMGKRKWESDIIDTPIKPSSSSTSNAKKRKTDYSETFLEKDFKNRMLYDKTRVARMDTKTLLKKKQKMKY